MSQLFTPYSIGPLQLENRIVIAPMCTYSAEDGHATDWHRIHLGQLAFSGAGLLIIEATAIEPEGRISPADLGLWSDSTAAALGDVLKSVRKYSAMPIAIQLAHAGRKAGSAPPWLPAQRGDWQTVAPSAQAFNDIDAAPAALDSAGLQRVLQGFVSAAQRAHRIGIDAIEIHAAHGYLLHQFLSPLSNLRTDEYGGSPENRMRFPLAVFDAVRESVPTSMPVGIRISATDWVAGGWDIEQSVVLAQALAKRDCAFIHVSSGGLSPLQAITPTPNYQVPLAARIRSESGLPTIAVGMVTEAEQAEAIIANGHADMVGVARVMLYNPHWPWHAAAKLGAQISAPPQYWRSHPVGMHPLFKPSAITA
ncbi:NADH:flavin oxidoreductase/NADH oxidase [Niveibacterium sp. 24ML]|uniref:NADH:flavin oxidoreductase/NADH oxidase n=1 Tax=Niveibacterium sp. 24ML TaxID=2985512 RepID=UPI002270241E|nr:NADH:flavin oxidoreductase/NADH oxidase [Niveibacterium sp. 24ML]MCX9155743.1 NADH:flavin oxidoreductase/NADH oxidase [Niveibacterium sp. 24ML]